MIAAFVPVPSGSIFVRAWLPESSVNRQHWLIHCPAFGEEMNKARWMVAAQARWLAQHGFSTIVADPHGTGDSPGDLCTADWEQWRADVIALIQHIKNESEQAPITLWGLRLGALLAADVARTLTEPVQSLLFWQPVFNGQQFMTQFLRLRMAAGLANASADKETVADLRQRLDQGEVLEVAGYRLNPGLVRTIDGLQLAELAPTSHTVVHWLEVVGKPDKPLLLPSRKLIQHWQEQGIEVQAQTVVGEPFWMTQELARADALLPASLNSLEAESKAAGQPVAVPVWLSGMSASGEQPVQFECEGSLLTGVLHRPETVNTITGVVIIVGGPQYRVGSHRQFLQLARTLAANGVPVLRFDYRGMGDSEGEYRGFEQIGPDLLAATDCLLKECSQVQQVVWWGLCDAASAASFHAADEPHVKGLFLLNPWVSDQAGIARTYLRYYYLQRIMSRAFWRKLLSGKFRLGESLKSAGELVQDARIQIPQADTEQMAEASLTERMFLGLNRFRGPIALVLSGHDLTASEFRDKSRAHRRFHKLLKQKHVTHFPMNDADHTFSRAEWKEQVEQATLKWFCEHSFTRH